jgi:hypothetical protein
MAPLLERLSMNGCQIGAQFCMLSCELLTLVEESLLPRTGPSAA